LANCSQRSVTGDRRPSISAEFEVEASEKDVDILADAIGAIECTGEVNEGDVMAAHEHVIVFKAERQIRRDPVFETNADRRTPAGFLGRIGYQAGRNIKDPIAIVGDGGTALYIKERIVPGVANLPREQAESVNACDR
jgi:hypothetical protein